MFYTEYVSSYTVATWFLDLCRQWHATTSQADEKFTQDLFDSKFGGNLLDAIEAARDTPPKVRTIGK